MDDLMMSEKYGGSCRSLAGSMNNGEFDMCYDEDDDEDPASLADLGVFDNVVRQHVMLKPMVSLVMEETEEELAREAARRASQLSTSSFTCRNESNGSGLGESPCEKDFGPSDVGMMGVEMNSVEPNLIMEQETPQENVTLSKGTLFRLTFVFLLSIVN